MIDPLASGTTASGFGELNALIGQNDAWLAAMEDAQSEQAERGDLGLGSFGVSGNCFFVLRDRSGIAYSRVVHLHLTNDGRLVDDGNRTVLGFGPSDGRLMALNVSGQAAGPNAFARYEVDERGVLAGIRTGGNQQQFGDARVELGRLGVAVFAAPEALARNGAVLAATKRSGKPHYVPADASNIAVQREPMSIRPEDMRENLRALWAASAHAELDVALAGSGDAMVRVALDAVK